MSGSLYDHTSFLGCSFVNSHPMTNRLRLYLLLLAGCWPASWSIAQDLSQLSTKKPVKITGSIGFRSYYSTGGQSPLYKANPFGVALAGSVNITFFSGISLPFSVAYSNRQTSFTQPFNQVGFSPTYKGFTLHAGYRNLRFSDYTLNGFTLLGGGLEVQKGWLRAGFIYGRLNRAVTSAEGIPTTFLRTGYAARLGIGTAQNFFDLILMQGKDDETSLPDYAKYGLNPARNTVVGLAMNKTFGKRQQVTFTADAGFSIYTGNINAAKIDSSIISQVPAVLYKSVEPNFSSRGLLAVSSSLGYNGRGFGIKAGYQRIDPGYTTMGMYNVSNDLEIFSLAPRFSLMKNKVTFNANLRLQRDDLYSEKLRKTQRFLPTATLSFNPSQAFGVSASVNYSTFNQSPGIKPINVTPGQAAALLMNQANYSVMVIPRVFFGNDALSHNISASVGTNQLVDNSGNADLKKNTEFSGLNASLNYSLSMDPKFLTTELGVSYFTLTNVGGVSKNIGLSAGATKGFLANKLTTNLNAGYNIGEQVNATTVSAGARLQPSKHQRLGFVLYQANSTDNSGTTARTFSEFRGTLDYTYSF